MLIRKPKASPKRYSSRIQKAYNILIVMICIQDPIKERKLIGNIGRNIEIEKICILENYKILAEPDNFSFILSIGS